MNGEAVGPGPSRPELDAWFEEEFMESDDSVYEGWGAARVEGPGAPEDLENKKTYQIRRYGGGTLTVRYREDVLPATPAEILDEGGSDGRYLDHAQLEDAVSRTEEGSGGSTLLFEFLYQGGEGWERFSDELAEAVSGLEDPPEIRIAAEDEERLGFGYRVE